MPGLCGTRRTSSRGRNPQSGGRICAWYPPDIRSSGCSFPWRLIYPADILSGLRFPTPGWGTRHSKQQINPQFWLGSHQSPRIICIFNSKCTYFCCSMTLDNVWKPKNNLRGIIFCFFIWKTLREISSLKRPLRKKYELKAETRRECSLGW